MTEDELRMRFALQRRLNAVLLACLSGAGGVALTKLHESMVNEITIAYGEQAQTGQNAILEAVATSELDAMFALALRISQQASPPKS